MHPLSITQITPEQLRSAKNVTTVIYALYAVSFFVGVTAIVAIIMNYVKKDDVLGSFLESHFLWQIRSFWYGLLWWAVAVVTLFIGIGLIVMGVTYVWLIYRIVKGWLRLNDNRPMYDQVAPL